MNNMYLCKNIYLKYLIVKDFMGIQNEKNWYYKIFLQACC